MSAGPVRPPPHHHVAQPSGALALADVRTPRLVRQLAWVLVALFITVPLILMFTPWIQTAVGSGRVVAFAPTDRQLNIEAPIEGRVIRWFVREGSVVKKGDAVLEIADIDPKLLGRLRAEREAVRARLRAQEQRAKATAARAGRLSGGRKSALVAAQARIRAAADATRGAKQAEEAARAGKKTALLNLDRQKALIDKGLTSQRTVELTELDSERARTELARSAAAVAGARNTERSLESERTRLAFDITAAVLDAQAAQAQAQADAAATRAELTRLDTRLSRQQAQSVKAPRDGVIFRVFVGQEGELVKPGEPLAAFVPDAQAPAVELWVDGNDMPLISEQRRVRLQFEGWPALQFSGWPSVAVGTFGGLVSLVDATDNGRGRFRVLVTPDPQDEPWPHERYLRQGVRANGWVLLDEVSLGFELWRRFNGFPPVLQPDAPGGGERKQGRSEKLPGPPGSGKNGSGKLKEESK